MTKIVGTGCIKRSMLLFCKIDPTKSLNGAGYRFQNGSLQKISPFRWALDILGPKMVTKNLGPLEKSRFSAGPI